jgi:hypothetical protein
VSGHGFSRAVKAQKEILPYAVGLRAAQRSANSYLQVMLGFFYRQLEAIGALLRLFGFLFKRQFGCHVTPFL